MEGLETSGRSKSIRKNAIGIGLIVAFAVLIFTVPPAIGKQINPFLGISALILVSVYVVLAFEMLHRVSIALLGAIIIVAAAIAFGKVHAEDSFGFVIQVIDYNTIGLLLGFMIIVAILAESGIFQWMAIKSSKASKGNLWKMMLILCTITAVASMFINNVTTILLMAPVTFSAFRIFKVSPIPFIIGQVFASNIGGTATLIGDPPNIMIGSAANIDFDAFIIHMGPTIAVSFAASMLLLKLFFRKDLKYRVQNLDELMSMYEDEHALLKDKGLLKKSMAVLIGVLVLLVVLGSVQPSVIAMGGAAVLLVLTRANVEKVLHEVDWSTLIFFTGLFIIVGTAEHSGLIQVLSHGTIALTGGNPWLTFITIVWSSTIASAFIDNIPLTATMIPLVQALNTNPSIVAAFGSLSHSPLWWALSLGANFGGNGTIIGSSAGIVAVGLCERSGYPISFNRWLRVGIPYMILTVAIGMAVLAIDTLLRF